MAVSWSWPWPCPCGGAEMALDAGLQAERTALAWSRTAHGARVSALVPLRAGIVGARRELAAIGLLLLVAAGLTYVCAHARRRMMFDAGPPVGAPAVALLGVAVMTVVCSVGALLAIAAAIGRA